jgi:NADPH:quinone reductase
MKAIYIEKTGGPEVMQFGDRPVPELKDDEVLVRVAYSGVNFTDLNQRSGTNKIPVPAVLGSEGAGTVERSNSPRFQPGDRVAWCMVRGSYAEYAAVPAKMLVKIPTGIDFSSAAAAMLQGMTAHYLTHSTFPVKSGHTVLIHAAAGGTGRLLVQIAAMLGARVIGTVGTPEKAQLAREAGASEATLYDQQDWVAEVKRLTLDTTGAKGVDVVYDGVGQATFLKGLDCLKPRGMMVHFGVSSGQIEPFDTRGLTTRGSLFLARPTLNTHIADPKELEWRSSDLFRWIEEGKVKLRIDREYPLSEAAQAHRDMEMRKTTGKLLLRI